jgi:hypothetical protein
MPNKSFLHKLALLGNYCCVIGMVVLLLVIVYKQLPAVFDKDFLYAFLFYFMLILPFVINSKAVKAGYQRN